MTELDTARFEEIPEGTGKFTRVLAITFIVLATAFWLFAFSPWARDIFTAPDQLEDESLLADMERLCATTHAEIDALPAASTAATPIDRAIVVNEATVKLENMVVEIGALRTEIADDARLLGLWLDDWQIYIRDRHTHAERLTTEGDVRFLNSEDNGIFVHERMDGFARVNNVDSCETPGDI
ncbi:MAG: hypothetical protein HKN94_04465 [Acidimicrobiales bacterium]|nr:hypothetical protein [Acidimicrobiales bacterium]RZV41838.1 MAG: hypothetical protein EX269_15755 [Acidimicrobiales bacterium]